MFFKGFHHKDQEILLQQLYTKRPNHDLTNPYNLEDIYEVARGYFSNAQFYRPPQHCLNNQEHEYDQDWRQCPSIQDPPHPSDNFQPSKPQENQRDYITKLVKLQQLQEQQAEEEKEIEGIITKMHGLSICDPNYAALYVKCMQRFPDVAKQLAGPVFCQTPTDTQQ